MKTYKNVTVLFDPQIFLLQRYGGISKYFSEIIRLFKSNPDLGITPVLETRKALSEQAISSLADFQMQRVKGRFSALLILAKYLGIRSSSNRDIDLLHTTFYLPGFLSRHKGLPHVATLHDMIPESAPRRFRLWNPHFAKKAFLSAASLVLSVSNSSIKPMVQKYGFSPTAATTYLGVGPEFKPNLARPVAQEKPYFLYVGNRGGYKDCVTAIRAFSRLVNYSPSVRLVVTGGGPLRRSERALLRKLGINHLVVQQTASSEELPNYYSNAVALLYPTQIEGFGLPLVEAMASGTAILASDTEVNNEICEEAATYFSVGDSEELAVKMHRLITGTEDFAAKIAIGLKRASEFTWARCAQKTASAYRDLLEGLQKEHN